MQHGRRKCWRERRTQALTAVGAVDELGLLGQECRGSLLVTSQMEEETEVISDQLCWGSSDFGAFIPLKTTQTQKHCAWRTACSSRTGRPSTLLFLKALSNKGHLQSSWTNYWNQKQKTSLQNGSLDYRLYQWDSIIQNCNRKKDGYRGLGWGDSFLFFLVFMLRCFHTLPVRTVTLHGCHVCQTLPLVITFTWAGAAWDTRNMRIKTQRPTGSSLRSTSSFHIYLDFYRNQRLQQQMWGSHSCPDEERLQVFYCQGPFSGLLRYRIQNRRVY